MTQPEKIIIADDHPLFRQALVTMLTTHFSNVAIIEAETVNELNELLTEHSDADLLLLDLNIPGAQGFNTLISVRKNYSSLGVVVVSGYEDKETVTKSISFGAAGFIPKSTSVDNMKSAIDAVLLGNVWTPENDDQQTSCSEAQTKVESLTPQQGKILAMFALGLLNKQIAYELGLSEATIKSHSSAIFLKLGVKNRTQAVIVYNQFQSETTAFTSQFD